MKWLWDGRKMRPAEKMGAGEKKKMEIEER